MFGPGPQNPSAPGAQRSVSRPTDTIHVLADLKIAAHAYLFDLEATGRSRYRQEKVELALRMLAEFLESRDRFLQVDTLTPDDIRDFLVWLRGERPAFGPDDPRRRDGRHLSARTVNDRLIDIKSFFNWLVRNEHLARSPARAIRTLPQPQAELAILTDDQVAALLAQPNRAHWAEYRNFAMMALLYDTGVRISELLGLRLEDLLWADYLLRVWGKGQIERRVPFGTEGHRALRGWLQRRGNWSSDIVFVSAHGRRLDSRRVQRLLRHYGRMARITGVRVSPHTFRHTFATHFLRAGGDLFTLQAILGHRGLEMVRRYSHLAERDIRLRHRRFSPLDRLRDPDRRSSS